MKTILWKILWTAVLLIILCCGLWFRWQNAHPGLKHYNLGVDYAAASQIDRAESEWQAGVKEEPGFPGCYEKLGDLYQHGGSYAAAIDKYTTAVKLNPHNGRVFLQLALSQQKLNDTPSAAVSARRAAEIMPYDTNALSLYADLAQKINDMPRAEVAISRLHYLFPRDSAILFRLVRFDIAKMDMSAVERDLMPYIQTHKEDPEGCYLMEILLNNKPRTLESTKAAVEFGERAVAAKSNLPDSAILLGKFYLDEKRAKDALKIYLAAEQSHPNNEAVLQGLVECYVRLSQQDQAAKSVSRLTEVYGRHERMNHLKRELNANPKDVVAGLELPKLEEKDGDIASARADYVRILNQAPDDQRTHAALAAFYRRTGQSVLADKAVEMDYRENSR